VLEGAHNSNEHAPDNAGGEDYRGGAHDRGGARCGRHERCLDPGSGCAHDRADPAGDRADRVSARNQVGSYQ
jgi:hypothetical protein